MGLTYFSITGDFDARKVFENLRFYSRGSSNAKEVGFGGLEADKIGHEWEKETLKFLDLGTEVKLTFHNFLREQEEQSTTGYKERIMNFLYSLIDIKRTLYSLMHSPPKDTRYIHTLEIEISGEEQARRDTIKKIERITGITLSGESKTL